jgi:TonB family protein
MSEMAWLHQLFVFLLHSSCKMKSKLFIALSTFTVVFVLMLTLRSQTDQPVLRVGHGVIAPRPLNHPNPEYSEEARQAGLQGNCVLSLIVNSEGKPENVNVSRSLGMGLDEKAMEAVRRWTFEPARKDGKPVAVQISVVVTFRIGKDAAMMTPNAREALERAQKAGEEVRRNAWQRVYRVEDSTAASLCHSKYKEDEDDAPVSISGLKTDVREYRLESITFTNNKTLTNAATLRSLFPIDDGEPFDASKVADGLQTLKRVYHTQGFVSFKSSVNPEIDDSHRSVVLQIKCEEGRQFYVDHINIAGLNERTFQKIRKSLYVKPGDLYNERLASLWLEKNSRLIAPDKSVRNRMKLDANEDVGTVVMTYDFTRCAD